MVQEQGIFNNANIESAKKEITEKVETIKAKSEATLQNKHCEG